MKQEGFLATLPTVVDAMDMASDEKTACANKKTDEVSRSTIRNFLMPKREKQWVRVKPLTKEAKAAIAVVCERFIADVLKPRFLPEVQPTAFNYPVDILGAWRGSKFGFISRFRSGFADNYGEEFNAPFCRLDYMEECLDKTCFEVMWYRHTGKWWCLHSAVTLEEALQLIETEPMLQPVL